jgi:hypothetical protein
MNSLENLKLTGRVHFVITGPDGVVKEDRVEDNLVVTSGLTYIRDRVSSASPPGLITHMELGTGVVAPAAGNTALGTALGTRGTVTITTPTATTIQYSSSFAAGAPAAGTNAITEAGLFTASTGGIMMCRVTFSAINKAPNDTMTVNWTITLAAV